MADKPLRIVQRAAPPAALPEEADPLLRRIFSGRGVMHADELSLELAQLLAPTELRGLPAAGAVLADAVVAGRRIVVAGDYDADGATGTALAVLGLRALGATEVDYVVPNRFTMGYGLSPALVRLAAERGAQLLLTVDNGIASLSGVAAARDLGIPVVITDHHLAGATLPAAQAIVNPNQPGCSFPSKHLAGVGVMFYVLSRVRAELQARGWFAQRARPQLAEFLDLVALGTVADVVPLDRNNRVLVAQGLARIRAGRCRPGIRALLRSAGREATALTATDLGFVLGPRINAAGRLDDIRIGIECLLASDEAAAQALAETLERINRERRALTATMSDEARVQVNVRDDGRVGVCLYDARWHEGVIGLVASRIKEQLHRPVIAFAPAQAPEMLKGSARSIPGLHVRDALAEVDALHPGLIERFGGHAMAAGLSLPADHLAAFRDAFDAACRRELGDGALDRRLETDGALRPEQLQVEVARRLEGISPWGQGFPEPCFDNEFEVLEARAVGSGALHVKYQFRGPGNAVINAIDFGGAGRRQTRGRVRAVYAMAVNRYNGRESLDLRILHLEPASGA